MTSDDKKKSVKKPVSKLGHDPLAWINDVNTDAAPGSDVVAVAETNSAQGEMNQSGHAGNTGNSQSANSATLTLPVYFGIAQSAEICSEMQKIMSSGVGSVLIAGGDVESFDTAAVQLIMAFRKQASTVGVEISWSSCSQKIMDVSNLLNISI